MTSGEAFFFGFMGGLLAQFLVFVPYQKVARKEWPEYLTFISYWVIAAGLILVGGYVSTLYASSVGPKYNALLATQVGATAPMILEKLFALTPKLPSKTEPEDP